MTRITVVGIGADGWDGLTPPARDALADAAQVIGSARQLALLPEAIGPRRVWPTPLTPLLDEIVAATDGGPVAVLASGDPMLHGIGATLARRTDLDPARLTVIPHLSASALACARLGWPAAEVTLVSAVGRPVEDVAAHLQPGRRIVVYLTGTDGAARLAGALRERGYGPSRFVVMAELGGAQQRITDTTATDWGVAPAAPLHLVAVNCTPEPGAPIHARTAGLPDDAYDSDGQLTKRHLRALAIAELAPTPGDLLWDVGAGSGSIATEWLRAEPTAQAVAVERDPVRAGRIAANARRLGASRLQLLEGEAPAVLAGLTPAPDAIFLGGGVSVPGMIDTVLRALAPGGRLVAHAVTLQSEATLAEAHGRLGGTLTRIEIAHAQPLGSFTGWRPQMPVVQWRTERAR